MADGSVEEKDDGAGKNNGGKFDIQKYLEQLKPDFKKLYRKDKYLPAALAYRTALRYFPLITENNNFDFWRQKIKLRSLYTLSHYEILLLVYRVCIHQSSTDMIQLNHIRNTVDPDSSASTPVYATAHAVAYAFSDNFPENSNGLYALYSVADAVNVAYVNGYYIFKNLIDHIKGDINFANTHSLEELMAQPIWPSGIPDNVIEIYVSKFKPAVIALAKEQVDKAIADALLKMLADYETLVQFDNGKKYIKRSVSAVTAAENESVIEDALNRERLVKALTNKLIHHSNHGHLTLGLLGHWGSGKTRILNLLKERLIHSKSHFVWGEFNAWAYEHTENIQAGMAHEIIQALTQYRIPFKENKKFPRFINYLRCKGYRLWRWLTWSATSRLFLAAEFVVHRYPVKSFVLGIVLLIGGFIVEFIGDNWNKISQFDASSFANFSKSIADLGLDNIAALGSMPFLLVWFYKQIKQLFSQPYTKELLTYIKLPSYAKHLGLVSEMRDDIALMCKLRLQKTFLGLGKPKRMVFVVDDLDRCSPDGIVKTLEAVRLILDIENVTVILAVDQRIALAALAYHYQEIQEFHTSGDAKTIARDYLGKIIHLPINIPEPDIETVKGYMGYVWQNDNDDSDELDWRQIVLPEDKTKMEQKAKTEESPEQPSEKPQDTDSEKDSDNKLTVEELAKLILEEPVPDAIKPTSKPESILKGLSPEQKAAFVYWTNQFQLTNPRQLKRLHNSYNLLQLVSEQNDEIVDSNQHLAFGYLITLITLEFINNLTQLELSGELKSWMFNLNKYNQLSVNSQHINQQNTDKLLEKLSSPQLENTCKTAKDIIEKAAQHFFKNSEGSKLSTKNQIHQLYEFVNAFVLPAIEVDMAHKS